MGDGGVQVEQVEFVPFTGVELPVLSFNQTTQDIALANTKGKLRTAPERDGRTMISKSLLANALASELGGIELKPQMDSKFKPYGGLNDDEAQTLVLDTGQGPYNGKVPIFNITPEQSLHGQQIGAELKVFIPYVDDATGKTKYQFYTYSQNNNGFWTFSTLEDVVFTMEDLPAQKELIQRSFETAKRSLLFQNRPNPEVV